MAFSRTPTDFETLPRDQQERVRQLAALEAGEQTPSDRFSAIQPPGEADLTLRRLLGSRRRQLALVALTVVVTAAGQQAGPKIVQLAINDGIDPAGSGPDFALVLGLAALYLGTVGIAMLAQRAQVMAAGRLAADAMRELRMRVFAHLQRLSMDFYGREKAGILITRMSSDIENLQQLLQDGLAQIALQVLTMALITVVLFTINAELALITLAIVVPPLLALSLWFRSRSIVGYTRVRDELSDTTAHLAESMYGMRTLIATNRQRPSIWNHDDHVGRYTAANHYTAHINGVYAPGTQVIGYLAQAVLLAVGGVMLAHGQVRVGDLVAFFLYLNRFFQPIQLLVQQYDQLQRGQSSITKLRGILTAPVTVAEKPGAPELPRLRGQVRLDHVDFGYEPGSPVLTDVDLTIEPGQSVSFVGATGAGKSTVAKLVTRLYDPTAGRVLLDGVDAREVTLGSLRRQVVMVPQEAFLFSGTVRENITFGRGQVAEADIVAVAERVGLPRVLRAGPGSCGRGTSAVLDLPVHERGASLSAGQRQLISLARALLADPAVLVLDEATSNLDLESEAAVERGLDVVLAGRTSILIAHRLSTAARADRVVVIEHGRVAEMGSHDELVAAGGRYARMYATWASGGEEPGAVEELSRPTPA